MKKTQTKGKKPKSVEKVAPSGNSWSEQSFLWLIVIPLVTYLVYHSVSTFAMTNWDDKHYMTEQPIVRGFSESNSKAIFTTKVLASYNPIVLLTYAFDFEIAKLEPGWCHKVNLFFHILNAILVFACMRKLRFRNSQAGMIALLFAIHPFASEAVAWIASRKDVVYGFFFLLSWLFYLNFKEKSNRIYFVLSFLFFTLSLLSKVQAITLPIVLFISDYVLSGEWKWRNLLNKIPFVLVSFVFGYIALFGSTYAADKYSIPLSMMDKILYSVMAFSLYVGKLFIPIQQTAIYLFPDSGSVQYWTLLGAGLAIIALLAFVVFKRLKSDPQLVGGIVFFAIMIFPVLHLIAVNSALIYERFIYLADIGIFMTFFWQAPQEWRLSSVKRFAIPVFILLCAVLTYNRIQVWKNSETLWTDVINKNANAADAYTNRGQYRAGIGNEDLALADYNESIRLKPNKPDGYNNRSIIFFNRKDWKNALADNWEVLRVDPEHVDGMVNRAAIYFNIEQYDSSLYYYSKALKISPRNSKAYYQRAATYYRMKKYQEAINDYKRTIEIIPDHADAYAYLSLAYLQLNDFVNCELAISSSEKYNPNSAARSMCSNEMLHQGNVSFDNKSPEKAQACYEKSAELWPQNAEAYFDLGGIYLMRNDIVKAKEYWRKTLEINPEHKKAQEWLQKTGG